MATKNSPKHVGVVSYICRLAKLVAPFVDNKTCLFLLHWWCLISR